MWLRSSDPRLQVLVVGQQKSFTRVLAANIQCWGHEVVVLPSMARMYDEELKCIKRTRNTAEPIVPPGERGSIRQ